jgi:hypothetical protein
MADDIDEQVTAHIREILHLVHGVKGKTLRKLNELVGQTSKFKLHSIIDIFAEVIMVQNYGVEADQEETSSLHMSVEIKLLRRSGRLRPREGTYENMQGRLAKRRKLAPDERSTNTLPLNGPSKEPATDASTSKTPNQTPSDTPSDTPNEAPNKAPSASPSESPSESPMDPYATSEPIVGEPSDTHVPVEGGEIASVSLEGILSQKEGFYILEEYFEESAVDSGPVNDTEGWERCLTSTVECIYQDRLLEPTGDLDILDLNPTVVSAAVSESGSSIVPSEPRSLSTVPTSYPPSETHDINSELPSVVRHAPCFKRSTLDESAQWLEHVLMALEAVDETNRRPNSSVPGVLDDILITSDFTLCVKIMTTIAENLVKCSRCIAKPAFDAA